MLVQEKEPSQNNPEDRLLLLRLLVGSACCLVAYLLLMRSLHGAPTELSASLQARIRAAVAIAAMPDSRSPSNVDARPPAVADGRTSPSDGPRGRAPVEMDAQNAKPIILALGAEWCEPCRRAKAEDWSNAPFRLQWVERLPSVVPADERIPRFAWESGGRWWYATPPGWHGKQRLIESWKSTQEGR